MMRSPFCSLGAIRENGLSPGGKKSSTSFGWSEGRIAAKTSSLGDCLSEPPIGLFIRSWPILQFLGRDTGWFLCKFIRCVVIDLVIVISIQKELRYVYNHAAMRLTSRRNGYHNFNWFFVVANYHLALMTIRVSAQTMPSAAPQQRRGALRTESGYQKDAGQTSSRPIL